MNWRNVLAKHYINLRGWKTNRKIVVIESDDWGSIRIPSQQVYSSLKTKGYPLDKNKFTSLDGLERKEDLELLFKVLQKYKDDKGNHPVITACAVVANPDFKKIKASDCKKYHFETIDKTYESYDELNLLALWKEIGIKQNLLYPQFHGREHLNPKKWLKVLNDDNQIETAAFKTQTLLGLSGEETKKEDNYMAAFEAISEDHKREIERNTVDGLSIFKNIFGFKSISFMPSQSKQFESLNKTLIKQGVLFNQGGQYFTSNGDGTFKKIDKLWGDRDQYGITYWRRNCTFEPYKNQKGNHVNSCLKEIEIAFRCGKPAVINSHRINYTSRINPGNRDQSLEKLDQLLKAIIKKWPEVEFMNSEMLGKTLITD